MLQVPSSLESISQTTNQHLNLKLGNHSINRPDDIAVIENSPRAQTPNRIELRTSATNVFDLKSEHID